MKILKLNNAIMLCPAKDETAINGAITINFEGVEEGATVTVRKNGKRETENKHIVKDKTIVLHVEEAKYTLCVGSSKIRFTVYEENHKMYIKRTKQDPEKTIDELYHLCLALYHKVQQQENKIKSMFGYETE